MNRYEVPIDAHPMVSLLVSVLQDIGDKPLPLLCAGINALPATAKLVVESDSSSGEEGKMILSVRYADGE